MPHRMDLTRIAKKAIYSLSPGFSGVRPDGERLSFTNFYMEIDGAPFYGVCGEVHFARLLENQWEDALLKMKAGGITIVSTYVFWNHHEETEGVFDFTERRDLCRFVSLCGKHGLYAIVRVGPFCHGEARNGGLPDWLYGKPFEVRGLDEGFLAYVRRWYERIGNQLKGLFYQDGGPVIAVQLDNEYMHSAAPWEMTCGCSNEWVPAGGDGNAYMLRLLEIARAAGLCAPFYTCTAWGGAATPDSMMPLWGGYAFRPWLFYTARAEHPATEEYIYRDHHNNAIPATYNFEPAYAPESKPYLCCEMGGGMFCSYNYRFRLPFESVDAMANIKLASGCNMLGYYMYHGGTNPRGHHGAFLHEGQTPKLSYDFQAPLGEYGQMRDSYRRLRALHLFVKSFEQALCSTKTVLPKGAENIRPKDTNTLRFAVRVGEDGSGFLFLNNYQDHAAMADKSGESICLTLPGEDIVFDNLSLAAGENCVLPFGLRIGDVLLRSAHCQPLTVLNTGGETIAFFFAPKGMTARYTFPAGTEIQPQSDSTRVIATEVVSVDAPGGLPHFTASQSGNRVLIVTLSREQSLRFSTVRYKGQTVVMMTDAAVLASEAEIRLEHDEARVSLCVFPDQTLSLEGAIADGSEGVFARYRLEQPAVSITPRVRRVGPTRYAIDIPQWDDDACKDALLRVHYQGDIGQAFIDGDLVADNFHNGAPWDIGLSALRSRLSRHPLILYITPQKGDSRVNVESTMAGRKEESGLLSATLERVEFRPVYQWRSG